MDVKLVGFRRALVGACQGLAILGGMVSMAQAQPVAQVRAYSVVDNTLLPQASIDAVLASRTGTLSFADIQKSAQLLQEAYRQAGYGAVVVQIPEQNLSAGVVKLEVVEGRLSYVNVTGLNVLGKDNILRSLPALQLKATPQLHALDRELLMANESPAKFTRVVFQPGEKRGEIEALAIVEEHMPLKWQTSLDNTGNDATGRYRLALSYQNPNVADTDSVLSVRATTSPTDSSQVGLMSASLRVPLYDYKTFLEWSAMVSNTKNSPNTTPAGELRFSGEGASMGVRAIWMVPTLGEYKQQAAVGVESRRSKNSCSLGSFGAAGCGTAAASVDVFPLTLGYGVQKPNVWLGAVQWVQSLPLDPAGSDDAHFAAVRPGAKSDYGYLKANGQGVVGLTERWSLAWRVEGQASAQVLVSAEQFGAGGASSVRGYQERALFGDSGAAASLELRTPVASWLDAKDTAPNLTVAVFADAAQVSNQRGTACTTGRTQCDIWSVGTGLSWRPTAQSNLRADVGRAGLALGDTAVGNWYLHFTMNHSF
ncbi:ShlB/FhaC/HecB family hemolysin secretion/activation protein [Rhodoferax aquaticus]|uniref:ShlB/FhaC/HecB family hemolysin secretion/activation protein n=1 Tax=Rhodoferax aquaticus TaxID=2527691 RepID=A0A515EU59_9BURK|nr:ShlB/FhaC/HecB family hemolysin secretion/activation protein [Rhodoferax aquaticus]QDL56210.1 ShlB/FhaC/HecB family hemolysin secretion/activation protein [Rhodoferax aquaticus]